MSPDARRPNYRSFIDVLRMRAADSPEALAFCFLIDGEEEGPRLTYAQLDREAQQIAVKLREVAGPGDRVLLLYPSGLEFISAFFGCLYANVVAVPASPPRLDRALQSVLGLSNISNDCKPSVVLTGGSVAEGLNDSCSGISSLEGLPWIVTDQLESGSQKWVDPQPGDDDLAMLQYTSGSTRIPRGVMLTHQNLLHNEQMMQSAFCHNDYPEYGVGVSWLPLHHDMGLFGNMLQTVYVGAASYLMSPFGLLQKPFRWLQAISKYRADSSGGPNFAFELCVRKITPEQRATLDLYNWSIACIGAEPIRPKVLDEFAETFESCGFFRETFYPAYGLAEATLFVTGGDKGTPHVVHQFPMEALQLQAPQNGLRDTSSLRTLVGCGRAWLDQKVIIVDPKTHLERLGGQVGEIWVSGPSVGQGYWNMPEETERIFGARLAETGEDRFLRTGDLGLFIDGELFVTGRMNEVIIIRGRNHYPHDIEETVQALHPALRPGCGAAFGIDVDGEEKLVIVQEIDRQSRKLDLRALIRDIRREVAEEHGLELHDLIFLRNATIPKTTSGKVQRMNCRTRYETDNLTLWKGKHTE